MVSTLARRWIVELKVLAMTGVVAVVAGAAAVLNSVQANSQLLGGMPGWLQAVLIVVAPTGGAFLAGWATKHTPRPDLAPRLDLTPPQ